jgi:hypothetical protein
MSILRRCLACKDWRACPGFEWYEPREIRWCFNQCLWVIQFMSILEIGEYPPDPTPTGYVGFGSKPQFRSGGNFITAAGLFAEIDWRLRRADGDGDTLKHEVQKLGVMNYLALSRAARNALAYVAGYKRKRKYGLWLSQRQYRAANKAIK